MIAEVLIATTGAVTLGIVGLGLRFADRVLHPEQIMRSDRKKAVADLEEAMRWKKRDEVTRDP